jgi:hypothetical protein
MAEADVPESFRRLRGWKGAVGRAYDDFAADQAAAWQAALEADPDSLDDIRQLTVEEQQLLSGLVSTLADIQSPEDWV